jgi:FkbM family methyltransferase
MKRFLFLIKAYPSRFRFALIALLLLERIRFLAPSLPKYFNHSFIESRRILGFVYDHEGTAISSAEGMQVKIKLKKHYDCYFLRWNSSDFVVFEQVIVKGEYLPIIELAEKHNLNVRSVVDAGGNIGCTTIFLKRYFPEVQMVTIEPDTKNFAALERNILQNKLQVTCLQNALWYEATKVSLSNDHLDKRDWSVKVAAQGSGDVETVTIGQLFDMMHLDALDVLKIDIEGAEVSIFKNDRKLSSLLSKVLVVAIELHSENDYGLISTTLKDSGFEIFKRSETIFGINRTRLSRADKIDAFQSHKDTIGQTAR